MNDSNSDTTAQDEESQTDGNVKDWIEYDEWQVNPEDIDRALRGSQVNIRVPDQTRRSSSRPRRCLKMTTSDDAAASGTENRRSRSILPEDGRDVWVERYPGGDMQIEVGSMYDTEQLYLSSGEADALREIVNELEELAEQDRGDSDE